ncbi:MAG TPA: hypothetical protein VK607_27430 [Kofleriaceae bacterium]|nr:hypothetical protein [Kofleriaceae bacterium]
MTDGLDMSEHITHREFQDAIAPLATKRELEIASSQKGVPLPAADDLRPRNDPANQIGSPSSKAGEPRAHFGAARPRGHSLWELPCHCIRVRAHMTVELR